MEKNTNSKIKTIKYSEPMAYFPKEIRNEITKAIAEKNKNNKKK